MEDAVKDILKSGVRCRVNGSLWLETSEGVRFLGPGPIELLERIIRTGSLSRAAVEMKMSYKKAWLLITQLNANAKIPIVLAQTGGDKGGGSIVTEAGLQLIRYHKELRERFRLFLEMETNGL